MVGTAFIGPARLEQTAGFKREEKKTTLPYFQFQKKLVATRPKCIGHGFSLTKFLANVNKIKLSQYFIQIVASLVESPILSVEYLLPPVWFGSFPKKM